MCKTHYPAKGLKCANTWWMGTQKKLVMLSRLPWGSRLAMWGPLLVKRGSMTTPPAKVLTKSVMAVVNCCTVTLVSGMIEEEWLAIQGRTKPMCWFLAFTMLERAFLSAKLMLRFFAPTCVTNQLSQMSQKLSGLTLLQLKWSSLSTRLIHRVDHYVPFRTVGKLIPLMLYARLKQLASWLLAARSQKLLMMQAAQEAIEKGLQESMQESFSRAAFR